METENYKSCRERILEEGYIVFKNVFSKRDLDLIREVSLDAIRKQSNEHREKNKSQGSLILVADYPQFAELIGHEMLKDLFRKLECEDPKFNSGYIISKPKHGPALFWHQDWWAWQDPISYTEEIAQFFAMIYLQDTDDQNGCLRVIPGTHRNPKILREHKNAHSDSVSRVENPEDPLYHPIKGEVEVPVSYGDVVIGDARMVHGALPNKTENERLLITLWFHPNYKKLPEEIKVRILEMFQRKGVDTDPYGNDSLTLEKWPISEKTKVSHLFPTVESNMKPIDWCREPLWEKFSDAGSA
jgi:hypothetical protein